MIPFIVFVFGLAVGSFLNSVIWRLEKGESFFYGRSYCPHCRHTLSWRDLIPVLSFVLLRGRCRYCSKPISLQYPLVELATGILFVLVFRYLNFDIANVIYLLTIVSILITIFVYDLKHFIIPDQLVYPAIAVSGIWYLVSSIQDTRYEILDTAYSALGAVFFLAVYLVSRGRWLGFGDVKLALLMGLFLGWPNVLVALFAAVVLGAVAGLALIALKEKTMKSEIPFGPFLVAGTFVALFFGKALVNWYLTLVLV
ncbi:MAG: prepilin peptidase [Candidatus Wildermuthbacteria bacterium]|nr:prepilin peptidase [Candidatus Wildermuthbacteria bacterium]